MRLAKGDREAMIALIEQRQKADMGQNNFYVQYHIPRMSHITGIGRNT
jgi:hypothetical protein